MTGTGGFRHSAALEFIAAVTLGILTVAAYLAQVKTLSATTTQTETVLFNMLEFVLTAGFTWFSSRAVSRREFEQDIRRFAISAYRRIADIERMVTRLHGEATAMIADCAEHERHNLVVIDAIASDASLLVRSSIADWADVIGDELLKIEKIRQLEREKETVRADEAGPEAESPSDAAREIERRISQIAASLPARLQLDVRGVDSQRSLQEAHAAGWIARQHRRQGGLQLSVVSGDEYRHDRDVESVNPGELLHTVNGSQLGVDVADGSGAIVGRLQNFTPLSYADFSKAMQVCYGEGPILLEAVGLLQSERRSGVLLSWLKVKVAAEPVISQGDSPERRGPRSSSSDAQ